MSTCAKKTVLCFFYSSLLALIGTSIFATTQQDQPTKELKGANTVNDPLQVASRLVNISRDWMRGKASTPGVTAYMREIRRDLDRGRLVVKYQVRISGAPRDQTYSFVQWPIDSATSSEQMRGLTLLSDGLVVCGGRAPDQCGSAEKKDDPVVFTFVPSKGEIFRLAFVSADTGAKVFFATIPNPIVKQDNACTLEVVRLAPKFELAMILARGFQPNANLLFASKSYGEVQEKDVRADADGDYTSALLPFVKDKQSGTTDLKLVGPTCAPALSFEWGK